MKMNFNSFIFISVLVNKYNTDRETTGDHRSKVTNCFSPTKVHLNTLSVYVFVYIKPDEPKSVYVKFAASSRTCTHRPGVKKTDK